MANEQNLRPVTNTQEAKERGKKGGVKSGEVRRAKRTLKESLEIMLGLKMRKGESKDITAFDNVEDINNNNNTVQDEIMQSMISKALAGDVQAAIYIRDTLGQKPVEKQSVDMNADVELTRVQVVDDIK